MRIRHLVRDNDTVTINTEWALGELDAFLELTTLVSPPSKPGLLNHRLNNRGRYEDIVSSANVVEQILARVLPAWRTDVPDDGNRSNRWFQHIEAVRRARTALQRQAEIDEKLGDNAPQLNAAHLHPGSGTAPGPSGRAPTTAKPSVRPLSRSTQKPRTS